MIEDSDQNPENDNKNETQDLSQITKENSLKEKPYQQDKIIVRNGVLFEDNIEKKLQEVGVLCPKESDHLSHIFEALTTASYHIDQLEKDANDLFALKNTLLILKQDEE